MMEMQAKKNHGDPFPQPNVVPTQSFPESAPGFSKPQSERPFGPFAPSNPNDISITIKNVDMPEDMQSYAISLAKEAITYEKTLRDVAGHIKRAFDTRYGPTWNAVVGKSFGSYCTHEAQGFLFFYADSLAIMLFKTA